MRFTYAVVPLVASMAGSALAAPMDNHVMGRATKNVVKPQKPGASASKATVAAPSKTTAARASKTTAAAASQETVNVGDPAKPVLEAAGTEGVKQTDAGDKDDVVDGKDDAGSGDDVADSQDPADSRDDVSDSTDPADTGDEGSDDTDDAGNEDDASGDKGKDVGGATKTVTVTATVTADAVTVTADVDAAENTGKVNLGPGIKLPQPIGPIRPPSLPLVAREFVLDQLD